MFKLIKNVASTDNANSSQRSEFICFSVSSLLSTFAWDGKAEDALSVLLACLCLHARSSERPCDLRLFNCGVFSWF